MKVLLLLFLLAQDDEGFLGFDPGSFRFTEGAFDVLVTGIADLEFYAVDRTAPGLIVADDPFLQPRLTLFLDAGIGDHFVVFLQARADRGLDPREGGSEVRADEFYLRYTLGEEERSLSLQIGKFATLLGNFVVRHDSMQNPLVRAPLPYDHVTTIGDRVPPADLSGQLARRDIDDLKDLWVPMIWGPLYHTGAMLFGSLGDFDARLALTNAAPSERPEEWNPDKDDFDRVALSARLGFIPLFGFKVGLNAAHGPYRRRGVPGREDQTLLGVDLEYSFGHLLLFGELYWSQWEVSNLAEDLSAIAYYVEARYKLSPGLYVAARWGQIHFSSIAGEAWDRDSWRAELGAGYFIYVNLLLKAEYEWNETDGPTDSGDNLGALSLSLAF